MSWIVFAVLVVLTIIFGSRIIITVLVAGLFGWLLCDINPDKNYIWYSGIWHGIFFVPNYIRHLVWNTPFKAEIYTSAYNRNRLRLPAYPRIPVTLTFALQSIYISA
jgi:hypothetical protein